MFLKISLVFPILLFSSISLHWSLRKTFITLLIFFETLQMDIFPLLFAFWICSFLSYLYDLLRQPFCLFAFLLLGMVLITTSHTMLWTSIHSSSGTLSDLIPWIYLALPLYNCKGFDLCHICGFPHFIQFKLHFTINSSLSGPQSAPSLVFADCIELLHLQLQSI